MQYYYQPSLSASEKQFILNAEESNHAVKVLRHIKGDVLNILNGEGGKFKAEITEAHPKGCTMNILEYIEDAKPAPNIHVAVALIKSRERMEWFVEKAVEIGANELSFFTSSHAEKKGLNEERMHKIAISALKQSGNTWLPRINPLVSLDKLINLPFEGMKFIAWCPVAETELLQDKHPGGKDAMILIGPEGDFTEEEVTNSKKSGFVEVSLGHNRLRTETAAMVSLVYLKL